MAGGQIMVCVTRQRTCERLIVEGSKLAALLGSDLSVVHVAKNGWDLLGNPSESQALDYLYQVSSEHGADMTMVRSDDVTDTLIEIAKRSEADVLVMGAPGKKSDRSMLQHLQNSLPGVNIHVVYTEE